jgi:hypothetical protein
MCVSAVVLSLSRERFPDAREYCVLLHMGFPCLGEPDHTRRINMTRARIAPSPYGFPDYIISRRRDYVQVCFTKVYGTLTMSKALRWTSNT